MIIFKNDNKKLTFISNDRKIMRKRFVIILYIIIFVIRRNVWFRPHFTDLLSFAMSWWNGGIFRSPGGLFCWRGAEKYRREPCWTNITVGWGITGVCGSWKLRWQLCTNSMTEESQKKGSVCTNVPTDRLKKSLYCADNMDNEQVDLQRSRWRYSKYNRQTLSLWSPSQREITIDATTVPIFLERYFQKR